jgi:hypothetical protein
MREPERGDSGRSAIGPTSAQLRNDIDSGRTGDKIAGFDPAAAPLGSDEEAAGTPPAPGLIAQTRAEEGAPHSARANAAEPDLAPDGEMKRTGPAWIGALGGAIAAVVVVALLVLLLRHA